ncbi:hypothetical protein [Phthorimaea operculella granulovirus]|uniref:Uncharacterized protein n=1 Tax=Phthorimaea operculella granulovirus TaxID=192584 RepID=Q8JRU4_9BBAC|nr:hypothetical protein [Phthorimaea operculella granulovirus]AAM70313.1 hypothetical protein [Phthorimaea operculella granulovirus]ANY57504.1 hypothetical protein PhopGVgp115 [Phthorimaea operculella granulovirus]QBH65950.1 hypothetical protein PhopGVgp115 [Phthorimaea operculella granulovirus]QBH66080.1 hypothetical protein PhopGVgp115 [Phthorimaea operculella granulovirus]QBH66210.1 hypothetical protein PhopGVgp115 [Phthorimaea operculella granulovirus]
MIFFTKQRFAGRRVAVVVSQNQIYFKLVEVIRILFDMCEHTYIDEMHLRVFEEFPNTKYVTMTGMNALADLSPKTAIAKRLQYWAQEIYWNLCLTILQNCRMMF